MLHASSDNLRMKLCENCNAEFLPRYNLVALQRFCSEDCRKKTYKLRIEFQAFYVYIDYRLDSGKAFYVGKGKQERIQNFSRNIRHKRIRENAGMNRIVLFGTLDEKFAFEEEVRLISELKTRDYDGGANFTDGGESSSGWIPSIETREKIGNANRGRTHSNETKEKLSSLLSGESNPNFGNRVERIEVFCKNCACAFFKRASRKQKFCSRKCFAQFISIAYMGANNPCFRKKNNATNG